MTMSTHESTHTSASHLNKFYVTFPEIRKKHFDGMIITGAPVELMEYEEVNYWPELTQIMEWSKTHVTSTMHLCWGAQAGLYYHYGIPKHLMKKKLSGIFTQKALDKRVPLLRSFDDYFKCPHSRYTEVREEDILKHPELRILAKSDEAGVFLVMNQDGSQIFVQGHPEYDRMTLNNEYHRDLNKGSESGTSGPLLRARRSVLGSAAPVEKYGEHAVYELAELLCLPGYSVYVGGGCGIKHRSTLIL